MTRTAVVQQPAGPFTYKERFRGLGDTSLLGWYRMRPIAQWNVLLNVGVSIPTGKTEVPRFRPELQGGNLVPMSRLQRGSGTVDPLLGLTATRRFGHLTVFGNLAARTPVYNNGDGLRTGSSWEVSGGTARELGTHRVVGYGRLGWLHRRQDQFDGTPVLVGGGNWLYVTPGVALKLFKGVDIQTEVKLPLYRSLTNHQLDSRAVFQFGVSRAF